MRTKYEAENGDFSNAAHLAARRLIYPKVLNCDRNELDFEDILFDMCERDRILDGKLGIDRIVKCKIKDLRFPLSITVQERFRRPEYAKYKDITITEFNHATEQPSELYKITAGLFLYGYYDELQDIFLDYIVINTTGLLLALARNELNYERRRNKKGQDFLTFTFDDLRNAGVVIDKLIF